MHIGFILTKSPSEQVFETFLDFQIICHTDQISTYLVGNGVYCAHKNYSNSDLEMVFESSTVYVYENDLKQEELRRQIKDGLIVFSKYDDMVTDVMENFNQAVSF